MSKYQNKTIIVSGFVNGITFFDTSNHQEIGSVGFTCPNLTSRAFVTYGDNVYIFGGKKNFGQSIDIIKLSVAGESLEEISAPELNGLSQVGTCYDQKDHIYLVNGLSQGYEHRRVSRFNVKTNQVEVVLPNGFDNDDLGYNDDLEEGATQSNVVYAPFYEDGLIYCISMAGKRNKEKMTIFNPETKSVQFLRDSNLPTLIGSVCSDGLGHIYMTSYEGDHFVRFDCETRQFVKLTPNNIMSSASMVYHNDELYFFGGVSEGNYIYSISNDQWTPFHTDDQQSRIWYGASVITL